MQNSCVEFFLNFIFTNLQNKSWMKLNIIFEVKDNGERYVAENKLNAFNFVVIQSGESAPNLHVSKG